MEARIRQLQQLLDTAIIGETPPDDGIVEPGMVVTVEMFGDETFLLGSREISDDSIQVFSEKSPIGAAVNGHSVGETVTYATPRARTCRSRSSRPSPTEADRSPAARSLGPERLENPRLVLRASRFQDQPDLDLVDADLR